MQCISTERRINDKGKKKKEMTFPQRNNQLFPIHTVVCRYVIQLGGAGTSWENDFTINSRYRCEKNALIQHLNMCNVDMVVYL